MCQCRLWCNRQNHRQSSIHRCSENRSLGSSVDTTSHSVSQTRRRSFPGYFSHASPPPPPPLPQSPLPTPTPISCTGISHDVPTLLTLVLVCSFLSFFICFVFVWEVCLFWFALFRFAFFSFICFVLCCINFLFHFAKHAVFDRYTLPHILTVWDNILKEIRVGVSHPQRNSFPASIHFSIAKTCHCSNSSQPPHLFAGM